MQLHELSAVFGLGIIFTILIVTIRGRYPEMAILLSIGFVVIAFTRFLGPLREVIRIFYGLAEKAELRTSYLDIAVKTIGIAYIASFGAQMSKDAKEESVAVVIEFAGKIIILVLGLPVLVAIVDTLVRLLP